MTDRYLAHTPGVLSARVGDTTLVLTPSDEVLRLDGVAAWTWDRLATPASAAGIADAAIAEFSVDPQVASSQISSFVEDLIAAGVVDWRKA